MFMSDSEKNQQVELLKSLGKRIKRLRTQRGKTQAQLADFAEITPQYLSEIEQGKTNASIGILANLARELNIPHLTSLKIRSLLPKKRLPGKSMKN